MRSVYPRGMDLSLHVSSLVTALCHRLGQLQVSLTYLACPLARSQSIHFKVLKLNLVLLFIQINDKISRILCVWAWIEAHMTFQDGRRCKTVNHVFVCKLKFGHIVSFLPMFGRLLYTGWPLNWASKERSRTIWGRVVVASQFQGDLSPKLFATSDSKVAKLVREHVGMFCWKSCLGIYRAHRSL